MKIKNIKLTVQLKMFAGMEILREKKSAMMEIFKMATVAVQDAS